MQSQPGVSRNADAASISMIRSFMYFRLWNARGKGRRHDAALAAMSHSDLSPVSILVEAPHGFSAHARRPPRVGVPGVGCGVTRRAVLAAIETASACSGTRKGFVKSEGDSRSGWRHLNERGQPVKEL
jgi:hypothetical protein